MASKRALNVLHVIPAVAPRYGGPSHAVVGMGKALGAQGLPVLIATTDADGRAALPVPLGTPVDWQGVPTIMFRRQLSEAFKYSRPLASWLDRHVAEFDVVHVHAVFSHACLAAARASQKHKVPYVVRPLGSLDPWSLRQKPLRKRVLWQLGVGQMLAGAAAVQYTTIAEQRLAEVPLGLKRGVVIPIGIDDEAFHSAEQRARVVLALGRLHPKKGLEALIEAFADVSSGGQFAEWRLVIAGDGEPNYVSRLKAQAAAHTHVQVEFVGWLEGSAKVDALRHASLLALPSHQENFGIVVLEAMACGTPVLVSAHVNLADEIEASEAGWVVSLDPRALQAGLAEALSNADERARRGAAALELATRFTWPSVASDLVRLYERLAA